MNQLRSWPTRRWLVAAATALSTVLFIGVPTDLIDTPLFSREIPPTWWAWPALLVSSVLAGLLAAGLLTFFAVGCPVCNKIVLLALGSAGALTWFEPVQPVLQVAAVALLAWALRSRLRGEIACPAPSAAP